MKRTLTLILACCICVCPVAGAGQPDMPKGAAVKFHFDNSVTDTDGNESLYLFNRKDCSEVTPVTEPDFDRATGGLRVNEYYAVDYDIYRINYDSIDNRSGPYAMHYPQIRNVPTFLYFRDGTLIDAHVGNYPSLEETLESKFLDLSLVVANDFIPSGRGSYYRDKAETIDSLGYGTSFLDSCLAKDEPLSVLFSWRRCQDCQEYKKDVLIPYLAESEPSPLLVYELDGYYLLKRDDDPENRETGLRLFSEFSKKYGLDGYPVEDSLGNIAGVAPTLVCYRGTERSLSVYRNDLGAVRNGDGTLSYSQSFYPEVLALKSKTTVEEGDTISDSYRKAMEELHDMAGPIEKEEASAFLKANL